MESLRSSGQEWAIARNHEPLVRLLINKRAYIHMFNFCGEPAPHYCNERLQSHRSITGRNGADLNARD